jgi:hypothetical protein
MAGDHGTTTDFQEIITRLDALKRVADNGEGKPPVIPLIDPTANVLSLVKAETQRQDDLRACELRRQDDLRNQGAMYEGKLAIAESKRLDALAGQEARRIDALLSAAANNVALASQKADAQAATLAAQVSSSAEALRNQVATTYASTTALINAQSESLGKRLTTLEQSQWNVSGERTQRVEGRQQNQWLIGFIMTIAFGLGAMVIKLITK